MKKTKRKSKGTKSLNVQNAANLLFVDAHWAELIAVLKANIPLRVWIPLMDFIDGTLSRARSASKDNRHGLQSRLKELSGIRAERYESSEMTAEDYVFYT